jgi:hypothetical protein
MSLTSNPKEFFEDIETDIDFKLKPLRYQLDDCKVHNGFLRSYSSIKSRVIKILENEQFDNIIITGHSLGGALSFICALDVKCQEKFKNTLIRCYTFATPRIGNKIFVQMCDNSFRSLSIRHINDAVPYIPQNIFGYCSLGHELFIGSNFCFIKSLFFHSIDKYIQTINEMIKTSQISRDIKIFKNKFMKWWHEFSVKTIKLI